jgi:ribosomal protein S27AE
LSKISERGFQVYVAVGGAIAPFIISGIIDKVKDVPLTTTFLTWLKWIWTNVFQYEFAVWQILLFLVVLFLILVLIAKPRKADPLEDGKNRLFKYTKDEFGGTEFSWHWEMGYLGKYEIRDLKPLCSTCGTAMMIDNPFFANSRATCPRCTNRSIYTSKGFAEIEAVIIDNLKRNNHKTEE